MALILTEEAFTRPLLFLYNLIGDDMKNELTCVYKDPLSFSVHHIVDEKEYVLNEGEKYRIKISRSLRNDADDDLMRVFDSASKQFNVETNLLPGKYYFQISLVNASGTKDTVISPATDADGIRLNTLIITERL